MSEGEFLLAFKGGGGFLLFNRFMQINVAVILNEFTKSRLTARELKIFEIFTFIKCATCKIGASVSVGLCTRAV